MNKILGALVVVVVLVACTTTPPAVDLKRAKECRDGGSSSCPDDPYYRIVEHDPFPLMPSLVGGMKKGSLYIKLSVFEKRTPIDFDDAIKKAPAGSPLIIDLRDNPGGYLVAATAILTRFAKSEETLLFTIRDSNDTLHPRRVSDVIEEVRRVYPTLKHTIGDLADRKVVLIVNERSASASETLAGVMQEWGYYVIGTKTVGKGVAQRMYDKENGRILIRTVFELLIGEERRPIHQVGILPSCVLPWWRHRVASYANVLMQSNKCP